LTIIYYIDIKNHISHPHIPPPHFIMMTFLDLNNDILHLNMTFIDLKKNDVKIIISKPLINDMS
jgi:hypothetical protein